MKTFLCETGVSERLHRKKMNNYVSFLLEAEKAKKRLGQLFDSGAPRKISHLSSAFAVFDSGRADRTPDAVSRIAELVQKRSQQGRP
jgi:hypothetical protein